MRHPRLTQLCGGTRAPHWLTVCLTLVSLLPCASPATAVIMVNDQWRDTTRTDPTPTNTASRYSEQGADHDGDGDLESAWFRAGDGTMTVVGVPGGSVPPAAVNGSPNVLEARTGSGSSSWTTYIAPETTPYTLNAVGENLQVMWVFTPIAAAAQANTSQNFRLALVDSPTAARVTSDAAPGSALYTGYAMFMNMSINAGATTTNNLGNGNPFRLMERDGTNAALLSSSTPPWSPLANGATAGNHGYDSGTSYTFTWTITRTAAGLDHLVTMAGGTLDNDGLASVAFSDVNGNGFAFDTFALRPSGASTTADVFDTTLFRVDYNSIPEASAFAMVGLLTAGAWGLCYLRRRSAA